MAGGAAAPRRSMGPTIAILVIIGVLAASLLGYGVIGYAYASSRISSADSTLNSVVDHENSISSTSDAQLTKLAGIAVSSTTTAADLQTDRTAADQFVTSSQSALPTVTSDAAALADATAKLSDQPWLTALSRGRLDSETARLGHAQKAVADQKTIMTDYTQIGQFYQSFLDENIDLVNIDAKATANDFTGAVAAAAALKTDSTKALTLANAPGLPAEVHQYQVDLQTLANDFVNFLNAVVAGNNSTAQSLVSKITADAKAVDTHDWTAIGNQITAFYKPLIDDYNAEGKLATG